MTTTKKQYDTINRILWILKFPEIGLTIGTLVGIVACVLGMITFYTPVVMLVGRLVLFPIRLYFVNIKRKLERSNPSLVKQKGGYVFKYG